MISWCRNPALNKNGRYLLQLCCSNGLCIMNTFFQHIDLLKYIWYRPSMAQKSLIDFCIALSDLFLEVLDVRLKRVAELSIDDHFVVCPIQFSKLWLSRKSHNLSVAYRIKWEALEDRDVRKQFASSMETKFQQLPEVSEDIKIEWSLLFQTAMIPSAVESCGRKQRRMAADNEKKHFDGTKMYKKLSE